MSVFSTNQVRHLYVATSLKTPSVLNTDDAGAIAVKTDNTKTHLYFEYKSADNLTRSDLIDIDKILYAKAISAMKMSTKLKTATVTLNPEVNGGNPVASQDYILRIILRQYLGMSDEDVYIKYGMVHTYTGMTASDFYKQLAISLAKNFSRETTSLFKFKIGDTEVLPNMKVEDIVGTADSLVIEEVEQPWRRGTLEQVPVYFTVQSTPIVIDGDERNWSTVTEGTGNTLGNGKKIADLEYFCMGERGDVYRGIGFPNTIETTYLVDPTKNYHVFELHYAYVGSNESVQKSEKDITIVFDNKSELTKFITAFNTATGLNISDISAE